MEMQFDLLYFIAGFAGGAILVWSLLTRQLKKLEQRSEEMNKQVQDLLQKNARLEQLEEKFALQFENLANRIFDEKTNKFKKESQESLGQLLNPLRERLQEFQKKVDDSFGAQVKEQISLKKEIENIISVNKKMSLQTENLTKALKGDVKAQGNWGEIILEKILENSGLRKGTDYIIQGASLGLRHAEDGSIIKPDVVIMLPEDKHIIVDAKVSLTAYERYCATEDVSLRARHLKEYLASIRAHVNGLEKRRYQDTEKLGTPDFVLMFMPVEGAYSLAIQEDIGLHGYAWDKKIVIVCPSILFATLKTIASVWRLELQNRHAQEIARQGGGLYDKIAGFVKDMQELGSRINKSQEVYNEAFKKLSTGNGNILKRTHDLKALGIKTSKKLPKELAEETESSVDILKKVEKG
ncbi:MAG: DNA recombination protein RmuC [Alphaproteobacteria bacterium]|nr:DNA recombination protein RmuC [Alphaproteobacteria bacterium]MCK5659020.1 DNA recombination protein RmuC [Alphaproteobacteria bacterium]